MSDDGSTRFAIAFRSWPNVTGFSGSDPPSLPVCVIESSHIDGCFVDASPGSGHECASAHESTAW
jgi:hypothetical protein